MRARAASKCTYPRPLHLCILAALLFPLLLASLLLRRVGASAAPASALTARAAALHLVSPPALNPWRASLLRGRLDWHDLVPLTFHVGVRGEAAAEALSRHLREDAKVSLLNVLQGRVGSALGSAREARRLRAAAPAADAPAQVWVAMGYGEAAAGGPLGALEGCPHVRDGCLLHGSLLACLGNSLCGWCAASSTCLTRGGGGGVPCAPSPGTPRGEAAGALELQGRRLEDAPGVLLVSAAAIATGDGARRRNCSVLAQEAVIAVEIAGNSKMAYHWAGETLPSWVRAAAGTPGGLGGVDTLVVYSGPWHDLLAMAYVFSRNCPRSKSERVLARVCSPGIAAAGWGARGQLAAVNAATDAPLALYDAAQSRAAGGGLDPQAALAQAVQQGGHRLSLKQAREVLGGIARGDAAFDAWLGPGAAAATPALRREAGWLASRGLALAQGADYPELAGAVCMGESSWGVEGGWDVSSGSSSGAGAAAPLVVILSRRDKRLLLNEEALVDLVASLGARAVLVALENLPLCAQVRLFRRAAVLLGMHGSGLINTMFMRPGSAVVQVVPFHLAGAGAFFRGTAEAHGVRYFEVPTRAREDAIAHPHFLKDAGKAEDFLQEGSGCCGSSTYFSFFINQDVLVDLEGARSVLAEALSSAG